MNLDTPVSHRQTGVALMLLTFAAMATRIQAATKEDYYNLTDYLFDGYKKNVRPVNNDYDKTVVYIAFCLYSIVDIDEQDQTMKTNAMLEIAWLDGYLSWNATDYGNIESVLAAQSSVWLPDIVVGNTVTSQTQLGYKDLQVRIYGSGLIYWLPTGVFETSCDFDVTYYPFDTQVCTVEFTSETSFAAELYIYIDKENPIDLTRYSPDGIWDLVNTSASNEDKADGRAKISFSLQLKRRPTFYILNVILPVVFLAMTSSLVFALPAESGEKMSLSITVLLAFAVFLTLITDAMPKTSVRVSVVMVYVIQLMALTATSVLLSVPLIRLHHRPSDKPMGKKVTKVIVLLRKIMCMTVDQRICKVAEAKTSSQNGDRISIVGEHKPQQHKQNAVAPFDNSHDNDSSRCASASSIKRSCEVRPVSGEVASETISMLLFYIFFIYSIVVTIVYVVILIAGGASQQESTNLS